MSSAAFIEAVPVAVCQRAHERWKQTTMATRPK